MIHRFVATALEKQYEVAVEHIEGDRFSVTIDGRTREIEARRVEGSVWSLLPPGGGAAATWALRLRPRMRASASARYFPFG